MKLLYLVHQFPPQFSTGTEVLTLETAKAQVAAGHQVEILTARVVCDLEERNGPLLSEKFDGVMVHRYPYCQSRPDGGNGPRRSDYEHVNIQRYLLQCIKSFNPDLVHAFHLYRISAEAVNTVKQAGLPFVYSMTDFWPVCPVINLRLPDGSVCAGADKNSFNCLRHLGGSMVPSFFKWLPVGLVPLVAWILGWCPLSKIREGAAILRRQGFMAQAFSRIDAFIIPSQVVKERIAPMRISVERMHDIPFGLNYSYLNGSIVKSKSVDLRIGFIGSITSPKGLHVLAKAIARLSKNAAIQLRIHGRMTDDPEYSQAVKELFGKDDRIFFLGSFPNADIGLVLSEIDVLVVPSVWLENTPLVISSAQAVSTPVIATNLGGMSEVITDNENGMLFPSGDDLALANCLQKLLDDDTMLPRFALAARRPLSIEEYAAKLDAIYVQLKMSRA